jgi:hypothetical protein
MSWSWELEEFGMGVISVNGDFGNNSLFGLPEKYSDTLNWEIDLIT